LIEALIEAGVGNIEKREEILGIIRVTGILLGILVEVDNLLYWYKKRDQLFLIFD
jgi:hypothetical protein